MKVLVIYDSQYGNTEKVAKAMAEALGREAKAVKVGQVKPTDFKDYAYIIIGSPTQGGGSPTKAMQAFVDGLTDEQIIGKRFAAFDTRLKGFLKLFGYAAPRIEATLKKKRANCTAQPQGFIVTNAKGSLMDGELERAATWAKAIVAGMPTNLMPGEFEVKTKE